MNVRDASLTKYRSGSIAARVNTKCLREEVPLYGCCRAAMDSGTVKFQPMPRHEEKRESAQRALASVKGGGTASRTSVGSSGSPMCLRIGVDS
jgi:hypothetical protein